MLGDIGTPNILYVSCKRGKSGIIDLKFFDEENSENLKKLQKNLPKKKQRRHKTNGGNKFLGLAADAGIGCVGQKRMQ